MMMIMANRAVCLHPDLEYSLVSSEGSLYILHTAGCRYQSYIFIIDYCPFFMCRLYCSFIGSSSKKQTKKINFDTL